MSTPKELMPFLQEMLTVFLNKSYDLVDHDAAEASRTLENNNVLDVRRYWGPRDGIEWPQNAQCSASRWIIGVLCAPREQTFRVVFHSQLEASQARADADLVFDLTGPER